MRWGRNLLAGCVAAGAIAGCLRAADAVHARQATATVVAARTNAGNPGVLELDPARFDRVVAISDVHGMARPLARLLQAGGVIDAKQRWVGGKTLLVVVGDSIDKGPASLDVLDLWLALQPQAAAAGGQLVHVLGNHEAEWLASNGQDDKADDLRAELQARHLPISELLDPARPRAAFLYAEPLALRAGRWLFLHAGLLPEMSWPSFKAAAASLLGARRYDDPLLIGKDSALEAKDWWADADTRSDLEKRLAADGMLGVVQGHQPKAYNLPYQVGAIDGGKLIKIDNGMAPEAGAHPGSLLVFPRAAELSSPGVPGALVLMPDGQTHELQPVQLSAGQPAPDDD